MQVLVFELIDVGLLSKRKAITLFLQLINETSQLLKPFYESPLFDLGLIVLRRVIVDHDIVITIL